MLSGVTRIREGRLGVGAVAGLLFAGIFVLRVLVPDPDAAILLLCTMPIALLAAEFGLRGGLAAALVSIALLAIWVQSETIQLGPVGYGTRVVTFLLTGAFIGWLADRRKRLEGQTNRQFELSLDLVALAGFDGCFRRVNPTFEKVLGYDEKELCSRPFVDFVHPDDRASTEAEAAALTQGHGDTVRFRNRYRASDGSYRWLEWAASADASQRQIYATARDITDIEESDTLRARLAAIVDSSDDAILSKSLDGTISSWNRGAERLYGYTAPEAIGRHISLLVPADKTDEVPEILRRLSAGNSVDHYETQRITKDGRTLEVALTMSPIRDGRGAVVGASTIARDVTESRRLQAELKQARDEALEASRLKSDFLATMSHEIRTPMNGVIGMTGLLLDTELDPEQREYAEIVRGSGQALLAIINDILDFSKIEAERLQLEIVDFDLRAVVEEVADLLSERAHAKGLELSTLVRPEISTAVRGDPGRLRQILTNLVGNAIKFTETGEVVVRAELARESDDEVAVRLEVSDTGIGIAADDQEALFEPFAQADASTTRTYGGTGLGLAITRRLVDMMGGRLEVHSNVGQGSTFGFTVELPKQSESPAEPPTTRPDLRGVRALIVDDNATNRRILEQQLASWSMHSDSADSAKSALERLQRVADGTVVYDIVLLDMEMPDMDGIELAQAIRDVPALASLPLVLLTSSGRRGSAQRARQVGISALLTKPVRQSHLYDAIATVMGTFQHADEPLVTRETIVQARWRMRPRLLIAEDNVVNQKVAVALVGKLGYSADVVENGAEAVQAAAGNGYGAILMDCQMPEMDGYTATGEIRRSEDADGRVPIIAMTAGAVKGEREKCLAAGMDDYVSKPVAVDELGEVLDRWVLREAEMPESPSPPPVVDPFDPDRVAALRALTAEGEEDIFTLTGRIFLDDAPGWLATLQEAIARRDAQETARMAHALKGSASSLGAVRLSRACAQLEETSLEETSHRENAVPEATALVRVEQEFRQAQTWLVEELG